jgi:hypothetical protein
MIVAYYAEQKLEVVVKKILASPDKSTVFVHGGVVMKAVRVIEWNGDTHPTVIVTRMEDDVFESAIGKPDESSLLLRGCFQQVVAMLHPRTQSEYHALFELDHPKPGDLAPIGFEDHRILNV